MNTYNIEYILKSLEVLEKEIMSIIHTMNFEHIDSESYFRLSKELENAFNKKKILIQQLEENNG